MFPKHVLYQTQLYPYDWISSATELNDYQFAESLYEGSILILPQASPSWKEQFL